jgi:hypothetical protein
MPGWRVITWAIFFWMVVLATFILVTANTEQPTDVDVAFVFGPIWVFVMVGLLVIWLVTRARGSRRAR